MTFGVNGLGNPKSNAGAAAKPAANLPEQAAPTLDAPNAVGDALALKAQGPAGETNSRQLAREFAETFTKLQGADAVAYEQLADAIGTPTYVLVDIVNRLCRDTQGEPLEDRIRALNMIQHVHALPDELRGLIEADLRRTSPAA